MKNTLSVAATFYVCFCFSVANCVFCRGHVSEITACAWHPKDPKRFITSSADSTIRFVGFVKFLRRPLFTYARFRIWDADNKRKQKTVIVVKSKERGARTKVTACNYSPDGNLIGGGAPRHFLLQKFLILDCSLPGRSSSHVADKFQFRTAKYDN